MSQGRGTNRGRGQGSMGEGVGALHVILRRCEACGGELGGGGVRQCRGGAASGQLWVEEGGKSARKAARGRNFDLSLSSPPSWRAHCVSIHVYDVTSCFPCMQPAPLYCSGLRPPCRCLASGVLQCGSSLGCPSTLQLVELGPGLSPALRTAAPTFSSVDDPSPRSCPTHLPPPPPLASLPPSHSCNLAFTVEIS